MGAAQWRIGDSVAGTRRFAAADGPCENGADPTALLAVLHERKTASAGPSDGACAAKWPPSLASVRDFAVHIGERNSPDGSSHGASAVRIRDDVRCAESDVGVQAERRAPFAQAGRPCA